MLNIQIGPSELKTEDRIAFFRTFGSWLTSGGGHTSVNEAIANTCDSFSHDEYKTLKPKMDMVMREYASGQTPLFEALRMAQLGFQPQELAIVEAAEKSNQLKVSIPSLVSALDIQFKGRSHLVKSMTMPLVIGFALIALSLGVMIFMLPMVLGPVLDRKPEALAKFPAILQGYWYTSVWVKANWPVPTAVLCFPVVVFILRKVKPVARRLAIVSMWLKPSRRLILSFNSVLVVFFMPALVRSGMPGYQVLQSLSGCVAHPDIAQLLKRASEDHRNGARMGETLKSLPFRASFANAVATGESTGQIAERVEDLQEPYRVEMERQINSTVATLKFFVMAILLPFFMVTTYTSLVGPIFALMEY